MKESTDAVDAQATVISTTAAPALKEAGAGFDVLAKNAFQAERVFTMMSGGAGLARAGPMLERLVTTLGGPAGLGFALIGIEFAVEKLLPTVEKLFGFSNTSAMKEAAEYWERIAKSAERLAEAKTGAEKKTAAEITSFLEESHPQVILSAITQSMREKAARTRTPKEQALMDVATPETGMTGAIAMHPMMALAAVRSRANIEETVKKQSQELFTQIATDPSARARVAQMAIERPGAFPPGFAGSMAGFGPEAEEAADKEMEETIAFGQAHHEAGVRRREHWKQKDAADRQEAAKTKLDVNEATAEATRREHDQAKTKRQEDIETRRDVNEATAEANKRDRDQAKTDRDHARQDTKYAREHTPAAERRAAVAREREQVAEVVGQANQQFGFAQTAGQLENITRGAVSNVNMGMDIATAVQNAVAQTQMKIQRDFMRGMQRQSSYGEMRGQ